MILSPRLLQGESRLSETEAEKFPPSFVPILKLHLTGLRRVKLSFEDPDK